MMPPAMAAMLIFVVVVMCFQCIGFGISRSIDYFFPSLGLLAFLLIFIGSMFGAWPVAVRITERFVSGAKPAL